MAFLGMFGKSRLERMKVSEARADLREVERIEKELVRRAYTHQDNIEAKRLYAKNEPGITELELELVADEVEEAELDLSAVQQELDKVREEKRAVKGILILIERRERLKKNGMWKTIVKMNPEQLEGALRRLGDMDAEVEDSVETIGRIIDAPNDRRTRRRSRSTRNHEIMAELTASRSDSEN